MRCLEEDRTNQPKLYFDKTPLKFSLCENRLEKSLNALIHLILVLMDSALIQNFMQVGKKLSFIGVVRKVYLLPQTSGESVIRKQLIICSRVTRNVIYSSVSFKDTDSLHPYLLKTESLTRRTHTTNRLLLLGVESDISLAKKSDFLCLLALHSSTFQKYQAEDHYAYTITSAHLQKISWLK